MDLLDFEVEVAPAPDGGFKVSVVRSPGGEATGTMRFPFDSLALENRLQALQIALLRSGNVRRGADTPEADTVRRFGQELWDALFAGDILAAFEVSRGEAREREAGIRVKLRFVSPELAALPWEYLYDPRRGDYLSLSTATPLVRYIPLPQAIEPLQVELPLRILAMVVSPPDLPALDVDRERQRLDQATAALRQRGVVELTWLPGQTWRDLSQALRQQEWHIFHFIGHGAFDPQRSEGLVVFESETGGAQRFSATDLGRLLGDHGPLRLAVLNSCESARGDQADIFSSTAATLVRHGTPAVVAMQYEITDRAAIEFSRSFYEAIGDGIPVDAALSEARKGIAFAIPDTLEWGTPVLFMRAPDGKLFDLPPRPRGAPAAPAIAAAATAPAAGRIATSAPAPGGAPETPEARTTALIGAAPPGHAARPRARAIGVIVACGLFAIAFLGLAAIWIGGGLVGPPPPSASASMAPSNTAASNPTTGSGGSLSRLLGVVPRMPGARCGERTDGLPAGVLAGWECVYQDGGLPNTVGFYLYDSVGSMDARFDATLVANAVSSDEAGCVSGQGGQGTYPGGRAACFLAQGAVGSRFANRHFANVRLTDPAQRVAIGVLGNDDRLAELYSWSMAHVLLP